MFTMLTQLFLLLVLYCYYFYLFINIFYIRSKLNSRLTSMRLMLSLMYLPTQNKMN